MNSTFPIQVKAYRGDASKRLLNITLALLVGNSLSHILFFESISLLNMFIYGVIIVAGLLTYFFATEPENVLTLTQDGLTYHHRYGEFSIPWSNIQRVAIPTLTVGFEQKELEYIGVRVKDSLALYESVPLRLASRLLVEQRALWLTVAQDACRSGQCAPDDFVDAIEFKAKSGQVYTGLIAMFFHRYERMAKELGFHFYIPNSAFTLPADRLLRLLKETKYEVEVIELSSLP